MRVILLPATISAALWFFCAIGMEKPENNEGFYGDEDVWIQYSDGSINQYKGAVVNQCEQLAGLAPGLPFDIGTCSRTSEISPITLEHVESTSAAELMKAIKQAQIDPFLASVEGDRQTIETAAYLGLREKMHLPILKHPATTLLQIGVDAVDDTDRWKNYCASLKKIHPRFQQDLMALIFNTYMQKQLPHKVQRFGITAHLLERADNQRFIPVLSEDESVLYLTERNSKATTVHLYTVATGECARSVDIKSEPRSFTDNLPKNFAEVIETVAIDKKNELVILLAGGVSRYNLSSQRRVFREYKELVGFEKEDCLYLTAASAQIAVQKNGGKEKKFAVLDLRNDETPAMITLEHDTKVSCAALSSDGSTLALITSSAIGKDRGTVSLWDAQRGTKKETLKCAPLSPHLVGPYDIPFEQHKATFVTFSPDNQYLAMLLCFDLNPERANHEKYQNSEHAAQQMGITLYHLASKKHAWVKEKRLIKPRKLFVANNGIVTICGDYEVEYEFVDVFKSILQYDMFNQGKKLCSLRILSSWPVREYVPNPDDGHISFYTKDKTHLCLWRVGESVKERKLTFPLAAVALYVMQQKKNRLEDCPEHIRKMCEQEQSQQSAAWNLIKRCLHNGNDPDVNHHKKDKFMICDCCRSFVQEDSKFWAAL